jgi:hypothetical protein
MKKNVYLQNKPLLPGKYGRFPAFSAAFKTLYVKARISISRITFFCQAKKLFFCVFLRFSMFFCKIAEFQKILAVNPDSMIR